MPKNDGFNIPLSQIYEHLRAAPGNIWSAAQEGGRQALEYGESEAERARQAPGAWVGEQAMKPVRMMPGVGDAISAGEAGLAGGRQAMNRIGVEATYRGDNPIPDVRLGGGKRVTPPTELSAPRTPELAPPPTPALLPSHEPFTDRTPPGAPDQGFQEQPNSPFGTGEALVRGAQGGYLTSPQEGMYKLDRFGSEAPLYTNQEDVLAQALQEEQTTRAGFAEDESAMGRVAEGNEVAAMEAPGAQFGPESPAEGNEELATDLGEKSAETDEGPGVWDRIAEVLGSEQTQRLISDVSRGGQRPGSNRPYAQRGFDEQSREIRGERFAEDEAGRRSEEAEATRGLKREELGQRASEGQADRESRERIAEENRGARADQTQAMVGEPIGEAGAAAMGLPTELAGMSARDAIAYKNAMTSQSRGEAAAAYQAMLTYRALDRSEELNKLVEMYMDPKTQSSLMMMSPDDANAFRQWARERGIPVGAMDAPPPGAAPPTEESQGWISQWWDRVKELTSNFGRGEETPSAPGIQPPGGEASPAGPSRGPLAGLSEQAQTTVGGIMEQHKGDPETAKRLLTEFANEAPQEEREAVMRILGPMIRDM